jgi:hypothetical protein
MYSVVVGNIGTVYNGWSEYLAKETYKDYVKQSMANYGRASNEQVSLFNGEEIVVEYTPIKAK